MSDKLKDLLTEHKRLVHELEHPNPTDLKLEAMTQGAELSEYQKKAKRLLKASKVGRVSAQRIYQNLGFQRQDQLQKGQNGDWQKEGYTLKHKIGSHPVRGYQNHGITAHDRQGNQVGSYQFETNPTGTAFVTDSQTAPGHDRKGLATAAYKLLEANAKTKIVPIRSEQTADARNFWSQPDRTFGKSQNTEVLRKPFKSEAQRKYFHWAAKQGKGGITPEMAAKWEAHTSGKLPEKLDKSANGDWQKEGYTLKHEQSKHPSKIFPSYQASHKVTAIAPDGSVAGRYIVHHHVQSNTLIPNNIETKPEHQRKGLASAAYRHIEKITGGKFQTFPEEQTSDGKALWSNPNRSFGKSLKSLLEPLAKAFKHPTVGKKHLVPGWEHHHPDLVTGLRPDNVADSDNNLGGLTPGVRIADHKLGTHRAVVKPVVSEGAFNGGFGVPTEQEDGTGHFLPEKHKHFNDPRFNTAHREAAYHRLASGFFGLGDHVPRTTLFKHPETGELHSAQEYRPNTVTHFGAEMVADKAGHDIGDYLNEKVGKGKLERMAIMNSILGNNDRHQGNVLYDKKTMQPHLIDNALSFDYGGMGHHERMPAYAEHMLHYGDHNPALEPETHHWLDQLNPIQFVHHLASVGAPPHLAAMAAQRLKAAKEWSTRSGQGIGNILRHGLDLLSTHKLDDSGRVPRVGSPAHSKQAFSQDKLWRDAAPRQAEKRVGTPTSSQVKADIAPKTPNSLSSFNDTPKHLKKTDSSQKWRMPSDQELSNEHDWEYRHVKSGLGDVFPDKTAFIQAAKQAKIVPMPDNVQRATQNHSVDDVRAMVSSYQYPRDVDRIVSGLKDPKIQLPAPIVIRHKGRHFMMAGNTRQDLARQHGIHPHVLMIDTGSKP